MNNSPRILVAGASGYIGRALIPRLLEKFPKAEITALSRSPQVSEDPRVSWRSCDLFSLKQIELALPQKADLAFYLVHSMGPTAQLDQGSFADYDLILADNFSRAIKKLGVRQVVYLGGLVPESKDLSLHLQSRLEVEETFEQHRLPTTVFRAAIILGEEGSSFQILLQLVKRLPIMVCPRWMNTLTTPVDLSTVLSALASAALDDRHIGKVYDLAGCKPLSYLQMMRETARRMGKRRYFITFPYFYPTLSALWVRWITNAPKDLIYPLVDSLQHPMVARETHLYSKEWAHRTYFDLLDKAYLKVGAGRQVFRFHAQRNTVRSVQRLPLPDGRDAEWVKNQYIHWLPRFLSPLIKVRLTGSRVIFSVFKQSWVFLELRLSRERSVPDRQLLYIKRGILVALENRGRLEFRVVLHRRFVLAAIHDYVPRLNWFIYKYTQALLHLVVMRAFRRYLARKSLER